MQKLIQTYNPIIEFVKDTFAYDIKKFVESNPNIITLGVSAGSALFTFLTGGINAFNANNRIPRRYITDHEDDGGDLRIYYPNILNDDNAQIFISDTFIENNINNKQTTITGGATTITNNNLSVNRALISDSSGKVAVSDITTTQLGYLSDVSNPIGNSITTLQSSITSLQSDKQDTLTTSSDSIITITNNIINSLWKKSNTNIYYNEGSVGIGLSSISSGYNLDIQGSAKISNIESYADYAILTPLLQSLTKRIVFGFDGSKYAKDLVQDIRYNYQGATYDSYQGINKYIGSISVNTGELYIYDDFIRTYPLDTESCSFSFWWYRGPSLIWTGTEYASVVLFRIDQYRINLLYNQRRRVKISYKGYTYLGQNLYKISVEYATNQNDYFIRENDPIAGGQNDWAYSEKLSYFVPDENYFKTPKFLSFNITKTSCTLFINGVQVATNTFTAPNVEFRLEKFYFPQNADYENPNTINQQFRFWGIYMNYNKLYTPNQVASLYRFETNSLLDTLNVTGNIKTNTLTTDTLYLKGETLSIPSSYNQKSLYEQPQEDGKITVQEKSNNRRSLSIDTIEVNTVNNIINNTGNSGFWYYADGNTETIAQIKTISYSELSDIPTSFPPSSH
jgi:GTP:adenosylcobinamide-phosphate guanylyltransferase